MILPYMQDIQERKERKEREEREQQQKLAEEKLERERREREEKQLELIRFQVRNELRAELEAARTQLAQREAALAQEKQRYVEQKRIESTLQVSLCWLCFNPVLFVGIPLDQPSHIHLFRCFHVYVVSSAVMYLRPGKSNVRMGSLAWSSV